MHKVPRVRACLQELHYNHIVVRYPVWPVSVIKGNVEWFMKTSLKPHENRLEVLLKPKLFRYSRATLE